MLAPRDRRSRRDFPTVALALGVLAAFGLLIGAPNASATGLDPAYGFSTHDGHFVLPYWQGLLAPYSITPGSTVFGDELWLEIIPNGQNSTGHITSVQTGDGDPIYGNLTVALDASNITTVQVILPSSTAQTTTRLCVNGGCVQFQHLTPITLLPSGVINVGGLDLVAFAITLETALLAFPSILIARYLTRKALYSPRAHVWLAVPHIVGAVLFGLAFDYPLYDRLFGGAGFLVFPVVLDVLIFFWALHLFNVAVPVEVLRPDPQGGHRLRYNRWRIWVGEFPDGSKVLVGTKWKDWLARLFGHAPILVPADIDGTKRGSPAEAPMLTVRSETRDERKDRRAKLPANARPFDDFRLVGANDLKEKDPPRFLYWVDSDHWLSVEMPHLSIHREVRVPAKLGPDGNVVEPAHIKSKLTWPHYIDPPTETGLAGFHYLYAPAAALGWVRGERMARRIEDLRIDNVALRTTGFITGDDLGAVQVAETFRLLERERLPLTDEEADQETRSWAPKPSDAGATSAEAEASERPPKLKDAKPKGVRP